MAGPSLQISSNATNPVNFIYVTSRPQIQLFLTNKYLCTLSSTALHDVARWWDNVRGYYPNWDLIIAQIYSTTTSRQSKRLAIPLDVCRGLILVDVRKKRCQNNVFHFRFVEDNKSLAFLSSHHLLCVKLSSVL